MGGVLHIVTAKHSPEGTPHLKERQVASSLDFLVQDFVLSPGRYAIIAPMVNYRRNKSDSPDAVYFLTLVTKERAIRFTTREDSLQLWFAMEFVRERHSVQFPAWVFLRNHIHWLICPGKADYSKVVLSFKSGTGLKFKEMGRLEKGVSLWQDRFWEHTIRDDRDYETHVDYIHFNPVKHGLAKAPVDWPYSTFKQFVKAGIYPKDWAAKNELTVPGECFD